ncbi:MAG: hypothetical protein ACREVL_08345 [Solimonas sp.]
MTDRARIAPLFAALALLAAGGAQAADCGLQDKVALRMFVTKPKDIFGASAEPVVTTSYRLGEPFDVKAGDLVLRRQISPANEIASFAEDVVYRSGIPFSTRYTLGKDQRYTLLKVTPAPALRALVLPALHDGDDEYLFLDAQGKLCEHALVYERKREYLVYRAGSYHAEPDVAATIAPGTPDATSGTGDAIVLSSLDPAALELSMRKSVDGRMGDAQKQSFDVRSAQIDIAGYGLRINSIKDGVASITVVSEPK